MTAVLDIIIAMLTGTLVIITIILTIFNVQQMAFNVETMLTLNTQANREISRTLEHILDKAGENISRTDPDPVFTIAEPDRMVFRWKEIYDTGDDILYDLFVDVNMDSPIDSLFIAFQSTPIIPNATSRYSTEPFYISRREIFTYFDASGDTLHFPITDLSNIYSCRVDMELIHRGWTADLDSRLRYPLTFWRYFKNIYIKTFA